MRECLWCGADLDKLGLREQAVWCSNSCRSHAFKWRSAHEAFQRAAGRMRRRPRRRVWIRPRGVNPGKGEQHG
jgi:hypothetical protein